MPIVPILSMVSPAKLREGSVGIAMIAIIGTTINTFGPLVTQSEKIALRIHTHSFYKKLFIINVGLQVPKN